MAFYSTRIDFDGNEIDCTSVSTSRTLVAQDTTRTMVQQSVSGRPLMAESPYPSNDFDFPDDLVSVSGTHTLGNEEDYTYRASQTDELSDIVPPLDLRSELDLSVESAPTFSCHMAKINGKAEGEPSKTYQVWLAKKLAAQGAEAARRRKDEERRQQEQEERKQLAEQKYQIWLAKKRQNSSGQKNQQAYETTQSSSSLSSSSTASSTTSSSAESSKSSKSAKSIAAAKSPISAKSAISLKSTVVSSSEKQRKIEEWERAKREQVKARRLKEKQAIEERAKLEAKRKEESSAAFNRWVQSNKNRPKPVPMNQGILSLRGTISDIFVNPNEWQSILD